MISALAALALIYATVAAAWGWRERLRTEAFMRVLAPVLDRVVEMAIKNVFRDLILTEHHRLARGGAL